VFLIVALARETLDGLELIDGDREWLYASDFFPLADFLNLLAALLCGHDRLLAFSHSIHGRTASTATVAQNLSMLTARQSPTPPAGSSARSLLLSIPFPGNRRSCGLNHGKSQRLFNHSTRETRGRDYWNL
jgi:hypothetical protein